MKTNNEILAPAGSAEQLYAAIRSGADAVYFGTKSLNARRNAENFDDDAFAEAVKQCHIRGVRVYAVLNTLVTDSEKKELLSALRTISESGADGIIVQDLAVVKAVKEFCPSLPLHASTQLAVHNLSGVKMLKHLGFSRAVLARELSYKEIAFICANSSIEIEVFVHGAHCMSASGMCYMSSVLGARSGNRGLCAQPCRLNFKAGQREYALSLKDMSLVTKLGELSAAGVSSFKIEGRMKRPEYVAAAVNACRQALNDEAPDISTLKDVFSRGGFTDGYFTAKRDLTMFGRRTKEDVTAAAGVLTPLHELYKNERQTTGLSLSLTVQKDIPAMLEATDGENTAEIKGPVPEAARSMGISEEYAAKQLTKLGGTPYFASVIKYSLDSSLMLPASVLNAMRREAVEALSEKRGEVRSHGFAFSKSFCEEAPVKLRSTGNKLYMRFEKASQLPDFIRCDRIIMPAGEIAAQWDVLEKHKGLLSAELPTLIYPADEKRIFELLVSLKEKGITRANAENIGAVYIARKAGLTVSGGHMLNILNKDALSLLTYLSVKDCTLSAEMSFGSMRSFEGMNVGFIGYGFLPLMRFRACPMQTENGCENCSGRRALTDRMGIDFTVLCSHKRYSTLLNSVPLYTADKNVPYTDFTTLYFTKETKEECGEIISLFTAKKSAPMKKTMGLYDKTLL